MKKEEENLRDELSVMMYVHGFMSGANGAKQQQLQKHFKGRYRIIAPELDADPDKSLAILNQIIEREHPEVIIGTSLGGWMTVMCDSHDAKLVIVNSSTEPYETLGRWLNQPQQYFCKRLDGVQTYTLTQEILDKYLKYDTLGEVKKKLNRLYALCSTRDELIGTRHIEMLKPVMSASHLTVVNDFGHQCRDAGMVHLYDILERILLKRTDGKNKEERIVRIATQESHDRAIKVMQHLKSSATDSGDDCSEIE